MGIQFIKILNMKLFATLATLGAASANTLKGHIIDLMAPAETQLAVTPVGTGICQGYDGFNFFDLKKFALHAQVDGITEVHAVSGASNYRFDYTLCGIPFKLGDKDPKAAIGKCEINKGNTPTLNTAYLVKDNVCQENYAGATFDGIDYKNGHNHGFHITWDSKQKCGAATKTVHLSAYCSPKLVSGLKFDVATLNSC